MNWSKLKFGKYEGKTLPQVLFSDPDWFFWAIEENAFEIQEEIMQEAKDLDYKSKNIKIPNNDDGLLNVEYITHQPTGKFQHFDIVLVSQPIHNGAIRLPNIDMSVARKIAIYDKLGYAKLLKSLKFYIFGKESVRVTKKKCETFFNEPDNFI